MFYSSSNAQCCSYAIASHVGSEPLQFARKDSKAQGVEDEEKHGGGIVNISADFFWLTDSMQKSRNNFRFEKG